MASLTKGQRRAIKWGAPAAIAIAAAILVARSPSLRASFRAAYVAFRDPSAVRDRDAGPPLDDPTRPPQVELEQPELGADFEPAAAADLTFGDAGAPEHAPLVLPDLGIAVSQRALKFVSYFAVEEKGRQAFTERFRRAGRYREHIEQALRDAELPEDLLWLVAIESAFNPQAVSPKGAVGLFQFMPETGSLYGLDQSELVDERRSITRSTAAGVAHLRDLFDRYQQWDLALAAYNYGYEHVDEAIDKLRERRGPRDADKPIELKDLAEARLIPKETANFVPQIQAFAIVAANRGRFGLDDLDPVPPLDFGEIAVPAGTPLRLIARAAGVSIGVLRDYNPDLLRDQAPPGVSDAIVLVPAERVSRTLAAFPALYAKEESRRLAAEGEDAGAGDAGAAAATPKASASASANPPAKPAEPPSDRWTLANGIVIERRPSTTQDAAISARIEIMEPARGGLRPAGRAFDVEPIRVRTDDLAAGLDRLAQSIRALAAGAGEAATLARQRAGSARRQTLDKAPYGSSWLALCDKLFPAGHALSSAVLVTPTLPLMSVAMAEGADRAPLRVTVTIAGAIDRSAAAASAERSLADALSPRGPMSLHPREDRVTLTEPVPSPRVLFGWIAPLADMNDAATLRLAVLALAHNELGRAARALVAERHVAVHVRGMLDLGERAGIVAIESVPAVLYDVAAVERELDRAIEAYAESGPTPQELTALKAQLHARLVAERARPGYPGDAKEVTLARLQRTDERAAQVTAEELKAFVKKVFARGHRVIVVTNPRG